MLLTFVTSQALNPIHFVGNNFENKHYFLVSHRKDWDSSHFSTTPNKKRTKKKKKALSFPAKVWGVGEGGRMSLNELYNRRIVHMVFCSLFLSSLFFASVEVGEFLVFSLTNADFGAWEKII